MKRGQAEIVGLILIVLLLAVGFLFYVKFALSPDKGHEAYERYGETQFGQTFVLSLSQMTVRCGSVDYTLEELLKMVGEGTTRCDAEGTINAEVQRVLDETLRPWEKNYRLRFLYKARNGEPQPIDGLDVLTNPDVPEEQRCADELPHSSDYQLIPLNLASVEIRLDQCT